MKNKWLLGSLALVGGLVFLFVLCVGIVAALLGDGDRFAGSEGVGLVELKGPIVDAQETVRQLRALKKDERVKAVVLRVDSPGGVVGPSQEIYAAVRDVTRAKQVVVSMGSVAASGGYYAAAPANLIYANPGTITGSIGVLMKFSNIEGLMGKIGLEAFTLKSGRFKDAGSPVRSMTEDERNMLQGVIDSTHGQFIKAVAQGRKLPEEEVRRIADGRIFTGEQALALKLVDRLGTLHDAVTEAGRLGGIEGEPELIRPPKKKGRLLDLVVAGAEERLGALTGLDGPVSVDYRLGW